MGEKECGCRRTAGLDGEEKEEVVVGVLVWD